MASRVVNRALGSVSSWVRERLRLCHFAQNRPACATSTILFDVLEMWPFFSAYVTTMNPSASRGSDQWGKKHALLCREMRKEALIPTHIERVEADLPRSWDRNIERIGCVALFMG
jgi:hypothetical protein